MKFKTAEKFISLNGEGPLAGQPAVFIRFAGCNLRCGYCDTAWAQEFDTGEDMSLEEIVRYVRESGVRNVTLTGGEPLMRDNMGELIAALLRIPCHVEIETNGSMDISDIAKMSPRPAFTLDYKLPGSGMEGAMLTSNYEYLQRDDAVKFVAGSMDDLLRAEEIIHGYKLTEKCRVYFSVVFGQLELSKAAEFIISHKINGAALQLQMHKYIWDPNRRGV
ncbi:MAG: putative 7-carboxy-7-deazaguanine synthase QueE [Oscillospiraceae bacterium]|nr:putative 7-carboxy-7-deazaguanine synthase QueE [Oscillospiraceae bacterium]